MKTNFTFLQYSKTTKCITRYIETYERQMRQASAGKMWLSLRGYVMALNAGQKRRKFYYGDDEKTNCISVPKADGLCADHGAVRTGNTFYRADPKLSGRDRGIFCGVFLIYPADAGDAF